MGGVCGAFHLSGSITPYRETRSWASFSLSLPAPIARNSPGSPIARGSPGSPGSPHSSSPTTSDSRTPSAHSNPKAGAVMAWLAPTRPETRLKQMTATVLVPGLGTFGCARPSHGSFGSAFGGSLRLAASMAPVVASQGAPCFAGRTPGTRLHKAKVQRARAELPLDRRDIGQLL